MQFAAAWTGVQDRQVHEIVSAVSIETGIPDHRLASDMGTPARWDLIETFKIMKGLSVIEENKLFKLNNNSNNRGHMYKIFKPRCRLDIKSIHFHIEF